MIRQDIDVEGYWKITIIYNAHLGHLDTGFAYSNLNKKHSIVGISPTSSKEQFLNTIVHEAKHVQSHICKYYNILETSEEAAYLIGFIVQKMYKVFKSILGTETC
jgi:hypothetical protein